jgi:DNA invertase Pin-like site-specific DNA recombinase
MNTAIYCRVSSPGQRDTSSLPEQERINRAKAAALGWTVSEPHVYHDVEGGEDLYRPQMDRLWDAIAAHEVDGVVVDVLDRLSRDEGDQAAFYHHCDRYGVTVELASQDYDQTEQGRTLRFVAGLHARMEHADIKRRTQRGRHARVAAGKILVGAYPLYGYVWADPAKGQRTRYVPDPETAPIVVRIYEQVAAGVSLSQIIRELEAEGVPTPGAVLASRGQWPPRAHDERHVAPRHDPAHRPAPRLCGRPRGLPLAEHQREGAPGGHGHHDQSPQHPRTRRR